MHKINSLNNLNETFVKNIRVSLWLVFTQWKDASESYARVLAEFLIVAIRFGLLIWLYYYLFEYNNGSIYGVDYQTVIWSMFFYFSFININPRYVCRYMQQDIKSGNIEVLFSKPINYLLYKYSVYVGSRLNIFAVNTVLGAVLLITFFGVPQTMFTLTFLFTFLPVFLFCFILSCMISALIGLLAFWMEDIVPIQWIIDKFVMILGGSYLPVAFFPKIMKELAIWTPFGSSQFITHTVYGTWASDWPKLIGIQIMWMLILGIAVHFMYKKALANASVNGG